MKLELSKLAVMLTSAVLLLVGCDAKQSNPARTSSAQDVYYVKGVIHEIKPDGKTAIIEHEEIPNYMPKMIMPLEAKHPKELAGLQSNDLVHFRMVVTADDAWIDQITKTGTARPTNPPARIPSTRLVRIVDPLKVGDPMPNYSFTNELGRTVTLTDLKGTAYAFTFIFTRCPLPMFCPRMGENFAAAAKKISAQAGAPTNWHLFSITFDVENDTPAALRNYAQRFRYDPARWSFLTGAIIDIDAITEQFGLYFARTPGSITFDHNLRTVVVDATGKIQHVFIGNEWKPDELVRELARAAATR